MEVVAQVRGLSVVDNLRYRLENVGRTDGLVIVIRIAGLLALAGVLALGFIQNREVLSGLLSVERMNRIFGYLAELARATTGNPANAATMLQLGALLVSVGIFILAVLRILLQSFRIVVRTIWKTILDLSGGVPPKVPADYDDLREVSKALAEGELLVPDQDVSFLKVAFGASASYIPPSSRRAVRGAGRRLSELSGRIVRYVIWAAILAGGAYWLHLEQTLSTFNPAFALALRNGGAIGIGWQVLMPFVGMVALVAVLAVLDFLFVSMLARRSLPGCASDRRVGDFVAGTKYQNILNQLPLHFDQNYALQGHPNRSARLSSEEASRTISDSGEFEASLMIERQPEPFSRPARSAALIRLASGWALLVLGVFVGLTFVLPAAAGQLLAGQSITIPSVIVPPLAAILYLLLSGRLRLSGLALIDEAESIERIQRYKSIVVLLRLTGSQNRAEVKIGRGRDDAIESSSEITRLELIAEVWAAEVVSEAAEPDRARSVVSCTNTDVSRVWADAMIEQTRSLSERKARTVGIDLTSESAEEIMIANVGLSARRAHDAQFAAQQPGTMLPGAGSGVFLPPADAGGGGTAPDGSPLPGYRLCPDCAEAVKELARKCRFCGHEFAH